MTLDPRRPEAATGGQDSRPSDAAPPVEAGAPVVRVEAPHEQSEHLLSEHAEHGRVAGLGSPGGHGGHGWMMLACCVPMVLIAVTLVATGVAGSGALVSALLCVVMMGAMMFFMPGHHTPRR